ncbi:MAG: ABC transporter permease [Acidimicrobiales bacterium]
MTWPAILATTRAEVRHRWRTLVLIGLLAGFVGATAVGALGVARRTTTAYDRLGEATGVDDARGSVLVHDDLVGEITTLPQVTERWTGRTGVAQLEGTFSFLGITAGPDEPSSLFHPVLIEGRPPRAAGGDVIEVVLREDFQQAFDVEMGTEVPVRFLTRADYFRFDSGFEGGSPHGPRRTLRVVGTARVAGGFSTTPPAFAGPDALRDHPSAFEPGASWFVRLRDGEASFPAFEDGVEALARDRSLPPEAAEFVVVDVSDTAQAAASAEHTAGLLGRALLALAGAVAVAGLVAVAQAFARHHGASADERRVESALGMTRSQRRAGLLLAGSLPALLAAAITVAGASLASRLDPVGAIEHYEPRPGAAPNLAIIGVGTVAVAAIVLVSCAVTAAIGAARAGSARPMRESAFVDRVSRLGGSPSGVTGLRFALEPGRGARAVPVRSAITGAIVGIAGVVAGLTFAASLDRLLASPSRSGIPFDVGVADVTPDEVEAILAEGDDLAAVVTQDGAPMVVDGRAIDGHALTDVRGSLDIDLAAGRLPATPDEITLGLRIADDLDVGVGDTVAATDGRGKAHTLAVVGIGVVPPFNGEQLGLNALLTPEGLERAARSEAFVSAVVRARPGADLQAITERLASEYEAEAPSVPTEVDNHGQFGRLPSSIAALVGMIALVALVNALVALVRRRRRDLAMLRTFGFTRQQTGVTVLVAAVTIVVIGLAVGIPVGAAIGSSIWQLTAAGAFVTTDALVRGPLVLSVAAIALVVAVVAALLPARRAARMAPATLLHTE